MGQTGKRSCLCFSLSKSHYFIANKLNLFSPSWVCFVCDSNLAEIELDAVHQVESHEGRAEENHVLSYASRIVFDAAQIGFLHCMHVLLACTKFLQVLPSPPQFIPQSVSMFWIALTELGGLSHQPVVSIPLPGPGSAVASGVQEQTSSSQ